MQTLITELANLNKERLAEAMHQNGYAIVPQLLTAEQCDELVANYHQPTLYRKTVVMERYRFGVGEYKYFNYPLPLIDPNLKNPFLSFISSYCQQLDEGFKYWAFFSRPTSRADCTL